jgi:hypothetical protein
LDLFLKKTSTISKALSPESLTIDIAPIPVGVDIAIIVLQLIH